MTQLKGKIMTTINVQPQLDLLASNVRYALARRGHNDAAGLVEILAVDADEARGLYSGKASYTVGQIGALADFCGVEPSGFFDENLIVDDMERDLDGERNA